MDNCCPNCTAPWGCPVVELLPPSPPVACVGCEVSFDTLYPNALYCGQCCDCLVWITSPYPVGIGGGECWFIHTWLTTGLKTVTASLFCGSQSGVGVTVIELVSLSPDVGTEFDDGDDNPNTKSFAVCGVVEPTHDPNVVTVTATTNPTVSEEEMLNCGCWSLQGGTGTRQLVRTVDRTTPGVTTITCICGTTLKRTKIYVGNPIIADSYIYFMKWVGRDWLPFMRPVTIKGYYDKNYVCWDSHYTSVGRKFNHMHAEDDFPFTVEVDINGDGNDEEVSVSASESDAYWDEYKYPESNGYIRISSATFSQNCHGHAQDKSYWIDENPIVIEDDYVQTTGPDGKFKYDSVQDHSIKILEFSGVPYIIAHVMKTSEKNHHSGVYRKEYPFPGVVLTPMYK